jgi:hypothetical protein
MRRYLCFIEQADHAFAEEEVGVNGLLRLDVPDLNAAGPGQGRVGVFARPCGNPGQLRIASS